MMGPTCDAQAQEMRLTEDQQITHQLHRAQEEIKARVEVGQLEMPDAVERISKHFNFDDEVTLASVLSKHMPQMLH